LNSEVGIFANCLLCAEGPLNPNAIKVDAPTPINAVFIIEGRFLPIKSLIEGFRSKKKH